MPEHGATGGGHTAGGVAGGMRRRPIDVHRKLPLVRSQKELTLDEDTSVANEAVRTPTPPIRTSRRPASHTDAIWPHAARTPDTGLKGV